MPLTDRLSLFVERADELGEAVNEQGFDFSLSWDMTVDSGNPRFERPKKGQVRSVMSLLRLFWLNKEATHFETLIPEAARCCAHQEIRDFLLECKAAWKNVCSGRGSMMLTVNQKAYSPRSVLDIYFNGDLAHSDPVKRAEMKQLQQLPFALDLPLLLAGRQLTKLVWVSSRAIAQGLNTDSFDDATLTQVGSPS